MTPWGTVGPMTGCIMNEPRRGMPRSGMAFIISIVSIGCEGIPATILLFFHPEPPSAM
jgi:hypothetical protein